MRAQVGTLSFGGSNAVFSNRQIAALSYGLFQQTKKAFFSTNECFPH